MRMRANALSFPRRQNSSFERDSSSMAYSHTECVALSEGDADSSCKIVWHGGERLALVAGERIPCASNAVRASPYRAVASSSVLATTCSTTFSPQMSRGLRCKRCKVVMCVYPRSFSAFNFRTSRSSSTRPTSHEFSVRAHIRAVICGLCSLRVALFSAGVKHRNARTTSAQLPLYTCTSSRIFSMRS